MATARLAFWLVVAAVLANGCSTAHYRRSADKEVYSIVASAERSALGKSREFRIDTRYSNRKPSQIPASEIIDDRLQSSVRVLSLENALNLAIQNSREYQTEKERLYLSALTLTGERYNFRPQFSGSSTATYNRLSDGERQRSINSRLDASQALKTGGRLGVAIANDLLRYYTGDPRRSAVSTVSVNLLQPLLRGIGGRNPAVENLTQAERNVIYAVRDYSFFQNEFAKNIVNDYFSLLAQKQVVRNRHANFQSRVQSTRRLEARAVDRERAVDVDQARQAELTAKNNYINVAATYQNSLNQFKISLGLPLGDHLQLDDELLTELESANLVLVEIDAMLAVRVAIKRQLKILNAIDRYEDSKRKVKVAADRLRADLNLFADASLNSEGATDYTKFDPNKISAGVGLELNLPFDRLRERNTYRATLVSFESQLRSFSLTLDNLKDSIERGLRTLEQRRQTYEIQRNALQLANRRVASATLLLEAGRAEIRDLIEAQDAQISAQNAVTAALVGYQEQRLQLMLDLGVLETESEKFWLKDYVGAELRAEPKDGVPQPPSHDLILPDKLFED